MGEYNRPQQIMPFTQLAQWLERHWHWSITVSPSGVVTIVVDPPVYADNAAALAAGMMAGQIYRTADYLKIVHS